MSDQNRERKENRDLEDALRIYYSREASRPRRPEQIWEHLERELGPQRRLPQPGELGSRLTTWFAVLLLLLMIGLIMMIFGALDGSWLTIAFEP